MKKKLSIFALSLSLVTILASGGQLVKAGYIEDVVNTYKFKFHTSGYALRENYTYKTIRFQNSYERTNTTTQNVSTTWSDIARGIYKTELKTCYYRTW